MFNFSALEALIKHVEEALVGDPAAQDLASGARAAVAKGKADVIALAGVGVDTAVADILSKGGLTPAQAAAAGALAQQSLISNAETILAPVEAKIDEDLEIPAKPEGAAQ